MQGTFQRSNACRDAGIGICTGRRSYAHGESRVVTTTMLCLDNQQKVKHASVQLGIVVVFQHIEEVLGDTLPFQRPADMQAPAPYGMTVNVVGVGDNSRYLGYQFNALAHQVVPAHVIGIRVKSIHLQYATSQDVHDVGAFQVYDMHRGAMVERHVIVEQFAESGQFLFVWQLTRQQQISDLLKTETFLGQQRRNQVIQLIATIIEFALRGTQLPLRVALITHHITYIGQTHEHARAILVAQSSLHAILAEIFLVDLASVLDSVTQFVNQIFLLHWLISFLYDACFSFA